MSKKLKEGEALKHLSRAYMLAQQALLMGQMPDFSLFKEVEELAQKAQQLTDYANCAHCGQSLELSKSQYSRFYLNQWNKCEGQGEMVHALSNEKRELVLCHACATPITTFLSKEG